MPRPGPGIGRRNESRNKSCLKEDPTPRPNFSREEQKVLKELRVDNNRVVLPADKGYVWLSWIKRSTLKMQKNY